MQFTRETLASVSRRIESIPAEKRPRVYYARGPDGLTTGLAGSINVEILERVGAHNVAAELGRGGLVQVSFEQVLRWDPDVIVTIDPRFYGEARRSPLWRTLRAVASGEIYLSPKVPYGWIDFPRSVNRLIGLRWLMQRILELSASGIGVLLSTHNPDHALIGADRVVLLHAGRILESGPPEHVITPQNLKTLYGVVVDLAKIERGRTRRTLCVPRLQSYRAFGKCLTLDSLTPNPSPRGRGERPAPKGLSPI